MKKSLIFGLIAVVSAGLLLAGCSQATDSDTTYLDKYAIYGEIGAEVLQARIDESIATGGMVVLADGLTIDDTNASVVDFKTAQVQVNGKVTAQGITINAVDASVTWLENGEFDTSSDGVYIYRNAEDILRPDNLSRITAGSGVQFVNRLQDIIETATAAAVRNFTFGPLEDYDYSTGTGISVKVNATGLTGLYVLGTLTVPADGVAPTLSDGITALGTVDVTGNNSVVFGGKVAMADPATLTSSQVGGAVITLPDTPSIPNVRIELGNDITVNSTTTTTFAVAGKLNGLGTLKVTSALTTLITIGGGNGNVVFTNAAIASTGLSIGSTGTTTFEGTFTNTSGAAYIAGDVVFKGNVTRTAGDVYFGGDVTLYNGKTLTLTTTGTVNLAAGKQIIVGGGAISGADGTVPFTPVLEAVTTTALTPVTGAVLTAGAAYGSTATEVELAAAKSIDLGTASLAITTGDLRVAAGSTLGITAKTLSTTGLAGRLSLADGATVTLSNSADSKIDFGTVASEATVAGNATNPVSLTASGAAVTLGNDTISGAGATLALGVGTGGSVDAVITTGAGKNLTLDGAVLDLSGSGKVTVVAAGSLTLVNQGTIFLAEGGSPVDYDYIKYDSEPYYATLGGGVRSALGATAQTETPADIVINSIAHLSGGGVTIRPDGSNALDFIKGSGAPKLTKAGS
jgi:hypothetical protein